MKRGLWIAAALLPTMLAQWAGAASWVFRQSSFSHDPRSGHRVAQFAPVPTPLVAVDPTYMQSGYRHYRSSIRVANSADHLHVVQTWGLGELIRPYGEWLYPFRAGATPFGPWGNPQGPWTLPFGSWVNPYGLGRLPSPPWFFWPDRAPYPAPYPLPPVGP